MRIDTAVQSSSRLRLLLYIALISLISSLAGLASLGLWHYLLLVSVSVGVGAYLALSRPTLQHLSQPPISQRADKGWQLLMHTGRGEALWQAELLNVHSYFWLIHFDFLTIEPFKKSISMTTYRDQVSPEDWRELNILATVMTTKTS